jgi:hypothetical protein
VAITATGGATVESADSVANPSPGDTPAEATFPAGFYSFNVRLPAPGATTSVQLTLPAGVTVNSYWKFGPEPGNTTPHWYEFNFDGTTGATISGNVVTLVFVDGLRGDGDLTANGVITDPGGPATTPPPAGGIPTLCDLIRTCCGIPICGAGFAPMFGFMLLSIVGMKRFRRRR